MPLTPETATLMAEIDAAGGKRFHQMTVAEAREAVNGFLELAGPAPAMPSQDSLLDVPGGRILVRVLTPGASRGVILYLHGGGWVFGTVAGHDGVARQLAAATGCTVVVPEYRLAPEHPFPVPLDDCWLALAWAAARFGQPLILCGDSAGANLAAVLAMRARDAGGPAIAAQLLVYPITDCDLERASFNAPDHQLILAKQDMAWFWAHYIADPGARSDPRASPLRSADLDRLPPACVITAGYDVLRDEGEAYAAALAAAGTPAELRRFDGETHGFLVLGGKTTGAAAAMAHLSAFLDRQL